MPDPNIGDYLNNDVMRSMAERMATEHLGFSPDKSQPQTDSMQSLARQYTGVDPYAMRAASQSPSATTFRPPEDSQQSLIQTLLHGDPGYDPMNPGGYKRPRLAAAFAGIGGVYGNVYRNRVQAGEAAHQEKMANIRAILGYQQKEGPTYRPFGPQGTGLYEQSTAKIGREPTPTPHVPVFAWPGMVPYDEQGRAGEPVGGEALPRGIWKNPATGKYEYIGTGRGGAAGATGFLSSPQGIFNRATGEILHPSQEKSKGYGTSVLGIYDKGTGAIVHESDPSLQVWLKAYTSAMNNPVVTLGIGSDPNAPQRAPAAIAEDVANQALAAWKSAHPQATKPTTGGPAPPGIGLDLQARMRARVRELMNPPNSLSPQAAAAQAKQEFAVAGSQ